MGSATQKSSKKAHTDETPHAAEVVIAAPVEENVATVMAEESKSVSQITAQYKQLLVDGELTAKMEKPEAEDFTTFWLLEKEFTPTATITPDMWKKMSRSELRVHLKENYPDTVKEVAAHGYTVQSLRQIVKRLKFTVQLRLNEDQYKAALDAYNAEQTGIYEKFKNSVLREFGVLGNEFAPKAFEKCWQRSLSKGESFDGAYSYFSDMVDLIPRGASC